MLVFVDESGDPGHKLERGSSLFFLIELVVFEEDYEAMRCDDAIAEARRRCGFSASREFHFSRDSRRVNEIFLEAVAPFRFWTHVFAVDKSKLRAGDLPSKEALYRWTAQAAFESAAGYLVDARVVLDESGDRQFQHELRTYLKRQVNAGERPTKAIRSVRSESSGSNSLLQLADYVAGLSGRALREMGSPNRPYLREGYLAAKERTFTVWPERRAGP